MSSDICVRGREVLVGTISGDELMRAAGRSGMNTNVRDQMPLDFYLALDTTVLLWAHYLTSLRLSF